MGEQSGEQLVNQQRKDRAYFIISLTEYDTVHHCLCSTHNK